MQENKYFKIKEIIQKNGVKIYKVYGYSTRLELFFGMGTQYHRDNITFMDALDQIDTLYSLLVVSKKTVYIITSQNSSELKTKKYETVKK